MTDYDDIDVVIDTDPIALGQRCRDAEAKGERLLAGLREIREVEVFNGTHHLDIMDWYDALTKAQDIARALIEQEGGNPAAAGLSELDEAETWVCEEHGGVMRPGNSPCALFDPIDNPCWPSEGEVT